MRPLICVFGAAVVLLAGAGPVQAQPPPPPVEPETPARLQFGPLAVRPSLIVREIGYDSNVMNESGDAQGDFTTTLGGRLELGVKAARVQGTYSTYYDYLYFSSFESERGSNGGAEGRVDVSLGRLQPYFAGGVNRSHERPNAEIDARASRLQSTVALGASFAAYSRTKLFAGYRHRGVDYADGEQFRGTELADQLNGTSEAITFGADFELSPLTSLAVHGERDRDRFDVSTERDADSYRFGATATFHPLALISGRASIGFRAFRPLSLVMEDFSGLTAAVAVAYAIRDRTRFGVTFDRDLRYSFEDLTPYYISTGGRLTITHRLYGNVDGEVFGGVERLAYEAWLDAADANNSTDSIRSVGGGLGYRLGDGSRVGITVDYATRSSTTDHRDYSRTRIYGTLTYGF
jgi:hypothetical protein